MGCYYIIKNTKNLLAYVGYTNSTLGVRWSHHNYNKDTLSREIIGKLPNPTIQVLEHSDDNGVREKEWFKKCTDDGYKLVNRRDFDAIPRLKYDKIDSELKFLRNYFSGIEGKNY